VPARGRRPASDSRGRAAARPRAAGGEAAHLHRGYAAATPDVAGRAGGARAAETATTAASVAAPAGPVVDESSISRDRPARQVLSHSRPYASGRAGMSVLPTTRPSSSTDASHARLPAVMDRPREGEIVSAPQDQGGSCVYGCEGRRSPPSAGPTRDPSISQGLPSASYSLHTLRASAASPPGNAHPASLRSTNCLRFRAPCRKRSPTPSVRSPTTRPKQTRCTGAERGPNEARKSCVAACGHSWS
jgi:hypothetical protein